ncbi:hypothetical protein HYC85_030014 [Camellia sinensis]|uniref:Uncharacterized protein n=1 Tax=Camellia sinensis TaxID=4442 RepID=A0A7J7FZI0_CAMSI|nr:hypothetical protein HYC85_030014 [Camellia sinensis]
MLYIACNMYCIIALVAFICILCYLISFCAVLRLESLSSGTFSGCVVRAPGRLLFGPPLTISAWFECPVPYAISACLEFISGCVVCAPGRLLFGPPLTISAWFECSIPYAFSACLEFISGCVVYAPGRLFSDLLSRFQRGLSVPFLTRFQRVWNLSQVALCAHLGGCCLDLLSRFQRGLSVPFLTRFQRVWNSSQVALCCVVRAPGRLLFGPPLTISAWFECPVPYAISACLEFISSCVVCAPGRLLFGPPLTISEWFECSIPYAFSACLEFISGCVVYAPGRLFSDLFSRFQRGLSVPFLTRFQRVWILSQVALCAHLSGFSDLFSRFQREVSESRLRALPPDFRALSCLASVCEPGSVFSVFSSRREGESRRPRASVRDRLTTSVCSGFWYTPHHHPFQQLGAVFQSLGAPFLRPRPAGPLVFKGVSPSTGNEVRFVLRVTERVSIPSRRHFGLSMMESSKSEIGSLPEPGTHSEDNCKQRLIGASRGILRTKRPEHASSIIRSRVEAVPGLHANLLLS